MAGSVDCVKKVLSGIEKEEMFAIDTPRAVLAKQAAKFILGADESILSGFCEQLQGDINSIVDRVKGAGYKSFATIHERLWVKFHDARNKKLKDVWKELWSTLGDQSFHKDPLLMQHCNTRVFEELVKINFSMPGSTIPIESLTNDEENALRYAAGFVVRSTHRKLSKTHHALKTPMLTILNQMVEDDSEDVTYMAYTKTWIEKINRGGLLLVDDETYLLFLAMELLVQV
ncbi:hypothetical protein SPONN_1430 [uncultured Candidatus Thioglobus sp.]|nr:hypothetical protein SPONN_1430 [uncultured Candidatus Thioglobus sp.]